VFINLFSEAEHFATILIVILEGTPEADSGQGFLERRGGSEPAPHQLGWSVNK